MTDHENEYPFSNMNAGQEWLEDERLRMEEEAQLEEQADDPTLCRTCHDSLDDEGVDHDRCTECRMEAP